jgi:hypothetical protein
MRHQLRAGPTLYSAVLAEALRPRQRVNRAAQALMPPLRLMKRSSASEAGLHMAAYRITRDHTGLSLCCRPSTSVAEYGWAASAASFLRRGAPRRGRAHGAAPGASGEIDVISRGSSMSILSAICSNRLATARNAPAKNLRSLAGRSARH